jgi:hypothetical protein
MYKKLFIPGPTDVDPSVLEKMATPMIGHRTAEATELQKSISEKLQKLMYTDDTILLSTSSGTGLMEGSIRSCTRKRAAVFSVGAFGNRWHQLATANNVPADIFKSEPGQPTTPEMVDEVLKTGKYDVVTVTHNETSSGVVNPCKEIGDVIRKYDDVLHLVDPSLCCASLNLTADKLLHDHKTFGLLFEALVERDLRIYTDYLGGHLYHFRDHASGDEVDAIIEFNDGSYAAFEIKLSQRGIQDAIASLSRFSNHVEKKPTFMCIVVGHCEAVMKDPKTGIYIVPATSLKP